MSDLNQRIAQLSPEKRELLLQRLNQKQAIVAPSQISRQSRDSNYFPLSFAQQRLWFLSQLEPNNPFYNQPTALRLTGQLNIAILKQSLKEIIRRHETLRTTFTIVNDKPVQVINSAVDLTLPIVNLQNLTPKLQEQEVQKLAAQEAQQPFNLEQGPLLRVTILKLSAIEHIVLFTTHHIVSDGWSVGILVQEVAKLYTALANNQPAPLPELPIQYADFAVWQRQYLTAEVIKTQISYWRNHLGNTPPLLDLPHDYPRPAILSYQGNTKFFLLSESLTKALKALSQQEGVTLFMTLLTAFKILLHRYSQQNDIVVGTAIANRHRAEIEPLIGFFVNTLVLRTNLAGNPSFRQLLQQVREVTLGAYAHQDLPFEQLVEELQPERHLNRNPLFDVMFSLQNAPTQELQLPGLTLSSLSKDSHTAILDLTLSMTETEQGLLGEMEYSTDLFDSSTIDRMVGHFQVLLAAIVTEPEQCLSKLPLLTAAEQHQLLVEWNDTQADYPTDQCIHELFEKQVIKTPEKIAVVFAESQLTYQELNITANQLARFLQNLGVQQGEFIAIVKQRDINFLIAILAIFKAGGVYVPIDSTYPESRIRYMVSNSEIRFLLTDSNWQDIHLSLDCPQLKHLIFLDSKADHKLLAETTSIKIYNQLDFAHLPTENLTVNHTGVAPAYMIYTSGSTGSPKGAIIRHGGAINHIYAQFDALQLTESLTFIQTAPASSDISVWQFLAPILIGGKTIIVDTDTVCSPSELFQVIQKHNITIVELVPVVLIALLDYVDSLSPQQRLLPHLQWMMVTGESVSVPLVNRWLQLYPDIKIVNAYGPTEAADDITQMIVDQPLPENSLTVPIGKPLANLNLYILDSQMQLVPIGVPGEICVSGFGVGLGYWKNEHKTNLSFISNPFVSTAKPLPGTNTDFIYKTGDLGRWLADGNIEFFGRIDNQVKIRGFRIELGEIEAVINQYPSVCTNVTLLREDIPGNKTLVAYLTVHPEQTLLIAELRRFLESKLPNYMLPTAIVILDALPLTPNGKVNRQALPLPEATHLIQQSNFVYASTPVQQMLVGIWKQVLGIEKLGIHDNFFELGGHSLLATQLISRIRQILHLELPLRCLFEAPTIAKLAAVIQTMVMQGQNWQNYPILPCSRPVKLPLSFAQNRLWFIDQLQPGNSAYNIFNGFRLQGSLNITALEQSINEIIRRHEILRTQFIVVDGQPVQAIIPELQLTLPVIDLQTLSAPAQAAAVQQLITQAAQQPFDLTQAPLLRLSLLKLSATEYIVLFAMHHIISDAWSMGILIRELTVLYQAYLNGEASPLAELSIQYADFAVWQREWLQGEMLQTLLSYWKQQLAGSLAILNLPYSQTKANTNRSGIHTFKLSTELSIALEKLSREADVTLFMTMVAGLQTLLYRYTGQDDIVIGTDVANRNRAETEGIIGFFVNLLVLRTNLGGYPSFRELLQRVREVTLGAYNHQDLPFEKLVEELQPERNLSHTPLFQVLLVMDNVPTANLELPGLTLLPLETNNQKAKFDLALFVSEIEQEIEASWCYNADLFDAQTIVHMAENFQELLHSIVTNPDTRINTLDMLTKAEKQQKNMGEINQEASKFKKFMGIKPKSVKLPAGELIKIDYLQPEQTIPLVIKPNIHEFNIIDWAKNNREFLSSKLQHHGAILFRDCQIDSVAKFEQLAQAICPELFGEYGDLPREEIGSKVYGSTPYPAAQAILFHNESSHMHCWPMKIWFFCLQPAQQGGETPIVDCRQLYQLLDSQIRETLEKKQLMYVRNYIEGLDVSWQDFFHTNDKTVVENYCSQAGIEFEWLANNNLRTRQIRPAIVNHPHTKEKIFFNQIQLHHISCLAPTVRESLLSMFGEENLPRNVYYGDGSAIEAEVMTEINQVYQQATISFPWQQGDVLMLDNMLTAHGRFPYVGSRKIVVAMGEMMKNSVFGHG